MKAREGMGSKNEEISNKVGKKGKDGKLEVHTRRYQFQSIGDLEVKEMKIKNEEIIIEIIQENIPELMNMILEVERIPVCSAQ